MASEYLVAWGHGRSSVEAVRNSDSDGWELAPEAIAWNQDQDGTKIYDDAWCVTLETTAEMRESLDRDPACVGYVTRAAPTTGRTAEAWWTWHDQDAARHSPGEDPVAATADAERRCAAWVAGESDDGPA